MSEIRVTIPNWLIIFFAIWFAASQFERWMRGRKSNER